MTARHQHLHAVEHQLGGIDELIFDLSTNHMVYERSLAGGLDGMYRSASGTFPSATDLSATAPEYYFFDWGGSNSTIAIDNGGWKNSGTYVSGYYGGTMPAGTTFTLDKGVYIWTMFCMLDGDPNPDTTIEPYVDYASAYWAHGTTDFENGYLVYWNTIAMRNDLLFNPRWMAQSGYVVAPVDNVVIAPLVYTRPGAAVAVQLAHINFSMNRIGGV